MHAKRGKGLPAGQHHAVKAHIIGRDRRPNAERP
jgi:hypothetical protein